MSQLDVNKERRDQKSRDRRSAAESCEPGKVGKAQEDLQSTISGVPILLRRGGVSLLSFFALEISPGSFSPEHRRRQGLLTLALIVCIVHIFET